MDTVNKKDASVPQSAAASGATEKQNLADKGYALPRRNLMLIAVGFCVVVIGFICMIGAPTGVAFDPDIFSFRRITLGPILAVLGFFFIIFAILHVKKDK